jgi:hypothetical protein
MFGALFALARRQYPRIVAGFMMLLSWPFWMFGNRRNPLLAIGIPLVAGYLIFSRQSKVLKFITITVLLLCVSSWFKVMLGTRTRGVTETVVAAARGENVGRGITADRHLGLDMFKELCYMNTFIDKGTYSVNWGRGYFGEAANFVPRRFWKDKPLLGVDYSLARGFRRRPGGSVVACIITTGVVGQGVENFGIILGPVAAAFLMAIWSGILARLWLQRESVLRTSMFLMGLGLTFNAGRNLTLQVFFPFVFGFMLMRLYEVYEKQHRLGSVSNP